MNSIYYLMFGLFLIGLKSNAQETMTENNHGNQKDRTELKNTKSKKDNAYLELTKNVQTIGDFISIDHNFNSNTFYLISDSLGREFQKGRLNVNRIIAVRNLPKGFYQVSVNKIPMLYFSKK